MEKYRRTHSSFTLLGSYGGEVAPEKNKNSESLNKEIDKFKYIKLNAAV